MELTMELKMETIRMAMTATLVSEAMQERYDSIQKLCETFKLSNKKLVKKLSVAQKIIPSTPSQQVFIDWCYVIYDASENNSLVIDEFYTLYKKKFPYKVSELEKVEKHYSQTQMEQCIEFIKPLEASKTIEYFFTYFLLFYSEVVVELEPFGISINDVMTELNYYLFSTEKFQDERNIKFNSGETILRTTQYKKYLKKRRTELAEFMTSFFSKKIEEVKLGEIIDEMLKSKACDKGIPLVVL